MKFALALGAAMVLASPTGLGANPVDIGINAICGAESAIEAAVAANGRIRDGVGTSEFKADTTNPEAQAWFSYGINTYHGFLHAETKQALAKAAELDPGCALCVWAEALSLGSTLNYAVTPAQTAAALAVADRAARVVKPGDERTAALVAALQLRYQPAAPPEGREQAFGKAMDAIARRYPDDDAIATMTAHALIIPARQDDYSGVARAQEILEAVLVRKPDETAAIHYYIHATEFAGHAPLALPYAKRLGSLAPTAGHLVHMGTHTLMRVGLYPEVARANAAAMQVDAETGSALSTIGNAPGTRYYLHNYLFGLGGAMMAGDRALSLKYADHARGGFPETTTDRYTIASARSLVALGRFAPDRALALTSAPTDTRLQKIYFHYARGEAFAAKGDAAAVEREAEAIAALRAEAAKVQGPILPPGRAAGVRGEAYQAGESANLPIAEVAAGVLKGRAAMLRGEASQAAVIFARTAIAQEKAFPVPKNFDPPPWWYPVRRSLAAAQLKAGRYAEAERAAHASLAEWPKDALALRILAEAEAGQGRKGAARDFTAEARKAWRGGDVAKVPLDLI
jgi:tetratricopeptide (TPR) repeat protein